MKFLSWVVFGALGFAMMCVGYYGRDRPDPNATWGHGLIALGPEPTAGLALPGGATPVLLRLLPGSARTQAILKGIEIGTPEKASAMRVQLRPKLIAVPFKALGIDEAALESGRLPSDQGKEALAGPGATPIEDLVSGKTTFKVVGRLKRDYGLFEGSYLLPIRDSMEASMPRDDPDVHAANLIQLSQDQMQDRKVLEQLDKAFPSSSYNRFTTQDRLDRNAFLTYIGGLAVMLIGGSGALISLYGSLAHRAAGHAPAGLQNDNPDGVESVGRKPWPAWLAAPLLELQRRPRLVWGVHTYYFGLVILGAILVHAIPEVQTVLLSSVRDALSAQTGPLGAAGRAYASGNVVRAAAVTFCVNFFMGSLLMITLPSIVVPGSGILVATLRSLTWGLLLAPTLALLALTMIPHSGTLLLEGEGYILAAIFGLLIPIHICQPSLGGNPMSRFGRVILLNVQASLWVAMVLLAAACYEAIEVIAMMR